MKTNLIKFFTLVIFTLFLLSSCGIYKRSDVKDNPINVDERVKKNIEEGRGFRFGKGATRGGDFDFASSNPLWRGAVDVLDFVPLTNASYSGGIIITEWYSAENSSESNNRELKLTVRFMSNEIRADAIQVLVFEKSCVQSNCNYYLDLIDFLFRYYQNLSNLSTQNHLKSIIQLRNQFQNHWYLVKN